MDQEMFITAVENLKEFARVNGSQVTKQDILDEFKGIELNDGQLQLVYGYLQSNKIKITDVDLKENKFEEIMDKSIEGQVDAENAVDEESAKRQEAKLQEINEQDKKFMDQYLEDLKGTKRMSQAEQDQMMEKSQQGDKKAEHKLVESFLLSIVDWVQPFQGKGVPVADLIQEANLTLLMLLAEGECGVQFEEELVKRINTALQNSVDEQKDTSMTGQKILNKVNAVNDCVERMYDELKRKVSVQEVAQEMGISEEDVKEAADLSADHIEHLNIEK